MAQMLKGPQLRARRQCYELWKQRKYLKMLKCNKSKPLIYKIISSLRDLSAGESGVTLIEILISLAIMGMILFTFVDSLGTAARASFIIDERSTANSLAKRQMEYIKDQEYDGVNNPPQYDVLTSLPSSYSINVSSTRIDSEGDGPDDDGIQKIVVTVSHADKIVITLEDYKVDR